MACLKLVVMRHGMAADHPPAGGGDHARPLTSAGIRATRQQGKELARLGWIPDRIHCSDARRAVMTLESMLEGLSADVATEMEPGFYSAVASDIVGTLAGASGETLMVIGHNPCLSELVSWLSVGFHGLRPGDVALLRMDGTGQDWTGLAGTAGDWQLEKMIPAGG